MSLRWAATKAPELARFLRWADDHDSGAGTGWRLLAYTGIRRGAALALRWRDVDLEQLRSSAPIETAKVEEKVTPEGPKSVQEAHSSAELLELVTGTATDAPLCMTCGTKMRPAGSCYVCEGCGSTSGCS